MWRQAACNVESFLVIPRSIRGGHCSLIFVGGRRARIVSRSRALGPGFSPGLPATTWDGFRSWVILQWPVWGYSGPYKHSSVAKRPSYI